MVLRILKKKKKTIILFFIIIIILLVIFGLIYEWMICNKSKELLQADSSIVCIFYRMSGSENGKGHDEPYDATDSDCIIIGNNGVWGLIDAGHTYSQTIKGEDGTTFDIPMWVKDSKGQDQQIGLSSQVEGLNGKDLAIFMHESLGINHLDFIIATHSHSDHIGGIPDIMKYSFFKDGKKKYLVDKTTKYFFKPYHSIANKEEISYHNDAFWYQAVSAAKRRRAELIDVSKGGSVHSETIRGSWGFDKRPNVDEGLSDNTITYQSNNHPEKDRMRFFSGEATITLFNLYTHFDIEDENTNSIITIVEAYGKTFYFGADINTYNGIEQQLAKVIKSSYKGIDVMKLSHHGRNGSNARESLDTLKPRYLVCSRQCNQGWEKGDQLTPLIYHCSRKKQYTRGVYESGLSDRALVLICGLNNMRFYNLKTINNKPILCKPDKCKNNCEFNDGWYKWNDVITDGDNNCWYYFDNKKPVTGWKVIDGKKYYFSKQGLLK